MLQGFVTPTHLLLVLGVIAVLFGGRIWHGLGRSTGRAVARGEPQRLLFGGRLTRRQAHVVWLLASIAIAFAVTRGVALPLFFGLFFVLWLFGFGMLVRYYR